MYDFILHLFIFGSLGTAVYVMARGLSRLEEAETVAPRSGLFDRLLTRLPLEKVDGALSVASEKGLRRLRVVVLRIDNWINAALSRVKRQSGEKQNGQKSELFAEKAGEPPLDGKAGEGEK